MYLTPWVQRPALLSKQKSIKISIAYPTRCDPTNPATQAIIFNHAKTEDVILLTFAELDSDCYLKRLLFNNELYHLSRCRVVHQIKGFATMQDIEIPIVK
jgi:hypothetical protein